MLNTLTISSLIRSQALRPPIPLHLIAQTMPQLMGIKEAPKPKSMLEWPLLNGKKVGDCTSRDLEAVKAKS
jgi:hypothetical protein